jgi:arylsulfatase A-like enzyme
MTRRIIACAVIGASLLCGAVAVAADPAPRRPNVVLIYADDMGYGDLSAFGNPLIQTRNLDSLAHDGVKFTSAYTTAPLCSPSRAGLLTGRYQQRFGFELQVSAGAYPEKRTVWQESDDSFVSVDRGDTSDFDRRGIPVSELNIAEILGPQGYRTAVIGKWHLGFRPQFQPQNRGFDYSLVFLGNTSLQFKEIDRLDIISRKVDWHDQLPHAAWTREGLSALRANGQIVDVDGYLLWRFRDEAINFIEQNKDQPFFLYLPFNVPVPPLQVPRSYYNQLGLIKDDNVRVYQAVLLAYDEALGKIFDRIRSLGLEDNTIVIFASDNGNAETRPGSNGPFSGGKFNTREGGIRTPYLVRWPSRLKPGQVYDQPVSTLDVLPTISAAANVALPVTKQVDGVNLLPYLDKPGKGAPHDVLYWKLDSSAAVRRGPWKLYIDTAQGIATLHDLDRDPGEKTDLAGAEPLVFAELKKLYADWEKTLPPRAWEW